MKNNDIFTDWKVKYEQEQPYTNDNFYEEENRMNEMINWFIDEGVEAKTKDELVKLIDQQIQIIYESVPLMGIDRIRSTIIEQLPESLKKLLQV